MDVKKVWFVCHYSMPPKYEMRVKTLKFAQCLGLKGIECIIFSASTIHNTNIDIVEQNQVKNIDRFFDNNGEKVNAVLTKAEYNLNCRNGNKAINNEAGQVIGYCYKGVVITKNEQKSHDHTIVYNVNTYVYWDIGFLNTLLVLSGKDRDSEAVVGGVWKITGEAVVKY